MNKRYLLIGTVFLFAVVCLMIDLTSKKTLAKKKIEDEPHVTTPVEITPVVIDEEPVLIASKDSGWSAQTKVILYLEDGDEIYEEGSGFFGQLKNSANKKDAQDSKSALTDTLEVVFPKEDWGEENGFYRSDYRELSENKGIDNALEWEFEVRCNGYDRFKNKSFEIFIDGIYNVVGTPEDDSMVYNNIHYLPKLRKQFFLTDRDTNKRHSYYQLQNVRFKMNDVCIRRFTWSSEKVLREDDLNTLVVQERKEKIISDFNDTPPRTSGNFGLPPF